MGGGVVRAVGGEPQSYPVTHGELVFHDGVEIWKDPKSTGQPVPQARQAWRELTAGNVVDAGGGDELVGDREIAWLRTSSTRRRARLLRSSGELIAAVTGTEGKGQS